MRSMDAVLPLSGGIGILVSETTVVSAATGGSRVGCGVGAPDAGVAEAVGLGVGAAVVATAATVGEADGPADEPPQDATRMTPAERIADRRIGRAVMVRPLCGIEDTPNERSAVARPAGRTVSGGRPT